jgi:hypothetical protein
MFKCINRFRMKPLYIATLLGFLALIPVSGVIADTHSSIENRFVFDMERGENGSINPATFLPMAWSKNWFSGLGYRDSTDSTTGTISGFADSKVSTQVSESSALFNVISYQEQLVNGLSYSIGLNYRIDQIETSEFGYFRLVSGAIDDYEAFDNQVDIDVDSVDLSGDLTWGKADDFLVVRLGMVLAPANSISVEQSTDIKPLVPTTGTSRSSISQDLGYLIKLDARFRASPLFYIGLFAEYRLLPLKYDVAILNSATLNSFELSRIDEHEVTTRIGIRLIFQNKVMAGMHPAIGFINEDLETIDQITRARNTVSDSKVVLGLTGEF